MPKYIVDVDLHIGETYTIEANNEDVAECEARELFVDKYALENTIMSYLESYSYEETDDEGED